jgi:hypothetical protein
MRHTSHNGRDARRTGRDGRVLESKDSESLLARLSEEACRLHRNCSSHPTEHLLQSVVDQQTF